MTQHWEIEQLKDTLATILKTFGNNPLPTSVFPHGTLREKCDHLAKELLLKVSDEEGSESIYKKIRHTILLQRRQEVIEYADVLKKSRGILLTFVRSLKSSSGKKQQAGEEIAAGIEKVEAALLSNDLESIRGVVAEAALSIKRALKRQRQLDQEQIAQLAQQLKAMKEELVVTRAKMKKDALTNIFNRKAFDESLPTALARARATERSMALFFIDMDNFKRINDTYGHQAGDHALNAMAQTLIRCFFRKDDFVGRYGGDEFVAYCSDVSFQEGLIIGERCRAAVAATELSFGDETIHLSSSVGFAISTPMDTVETLIERSDRALYTAKESGRNCVKGEAL